MTAQLKTVPFHGQTLSVIPQQDKLFVAIKPICENMGVTWGSQYNRIKRNQILSEGIFIMKTPSKGGDQETACLPLEMLNGWLFGIDTNRIKNPEVKARVIEYQRECYQVLFDYWTKGEAVNPRSQRSDVSDRKYGYYQERENQLQPALAIHYPMAAWPEINPQLKRDWAKDLASIVPNRHWVKARHLHGESAPSPTMRLLIQLKNAGFDVSCCEAEVLAMRHHIEMSESTRCEIERLMGRTHNLPVTA